MIPKVNATVHLLIRIFSIFIMMLHHASVRYLSQCSQAMPTAGYAYATKRRVENYP
ncbi:hypothetical protein GXM_02495 [Nostoc sphaeroides CCNUC1]|uniref:Uncharacterized protein n=1 Tax=Nostoc sphaeroides CCNUC1 TaxID=2653204 RepID=A0A5P8VXA9_9NOSO|nr:hypothetical protein GXM_02495 [Nostoc sphaeroides CCNUC1]